MISQVKCPLWVIIHCVDSTDAPPGFDLRVELYSCCVEEEFSVGFSTRRLSRLGSASSKKFMATLETAASCSSHGSRTVSGGGSSPGGESPVLLPALSVRWGGSIYAIACVNISYTQIHCTRKILNVETVSQHLGLYLPKPVYKHKQMHL